MKNLLKAKKLYKKILIILIVIYVSYIFISQQKTLNSYKSTDKYYISQITEKKEYKESLIKSKQNIDSKEYIERVARERLDMYLPNERIYIDNVN